MFCIKETFSKFATNKMRSQTETIVDISLIGDRLKKSNNTKFSSSDVIRHLISIHFTILNTIIFIADFANRYLIFMNNV